MLFATSRLDAKRLNRCRHQFEASMNRHIARETDPVARRCARRLRQDLGVNPAGAQVILQLRDQILDLQARIRELEAELAHQSGQRQLRVVQYRHLHLEASWFEIDEGK